VKQESGTETDVPVPVASNSRGIADDGDEDDDDDEEDDGSGALQEQDMPVSHEIVLKDHAKVRSLPSVFIPRTDLSSGHYRSCH
jgi:hypothetical protein